MRVSKRAMQYSPCWHEQKSQLRQTLAIAPRQSSSPEPTVGPSLVDLIHVLFDATTCAALYRRAALKLVPRCHMILRRSNGSNLNVQAGLTTEVIETLPASCAALLMQHSNSLAGSFSSSSHALRISFEVAWIEALVPLLGDVDVFVNETAAKH